MMILAIDSSGLAATVALQRDDVLVGEFTIHNKKTHSQTILPMIDEMIRMADVDKHEIDYVAVASGPGSFTGLRIGAATAKGLAQALDVPVVPVPTLAGLAYHYEGAHELVCPLMDARRNQAYYCVYEVEGETPKKITDEAAAPIEEIISFLNQQKRPVLFLGDGVPVFKEQLQKELTVPIRWATDPLRYQRAGSVAALASVYVERGQFIPAKEFAPVYLRLSQAERERREREHR